MNDIKKEVLWAAGSVIASLLLVGIFHIGAISQSVSSSLGTIAAGITNYTGISITGTPGTFDVSGTASFNGLLKSVAGRLNTYTSATTTMTATETFVAGDFTAYDTVILTPNVTGNTTLTLPASSTISTFLPTAGNSQTTCFVNGTTTAGAFYTFAGGTGTKLLTASSSVSAVGASTIYPQKMGCFTFTRGNTTATTFDILSAFTAFN